MTRSGFRRLWLLVLIVLMAVSYFVYNKTTDKKSQIDRQIVAKGRLIDEREASKMMASKLEKIDELTLHEQDATFLDILRFLSLEEERAFEFSSGTKVSQSVGDIMLFERNFVLKGSLPYRIAQQRIDELYENPRITVLGVKMQHINKPGEIVAVEVSAKMYSLDKGNDYQRNIIRRKR